MQISTVKKNIKSTSIKYGSILAVIVLILAGGYFYSSSLEEELDSIKRKVSSINSEISKKRNKYMDAEDNLEKFLKLPARKMPTESGYEKSFHRIKEIIPVIEDLKDSYSFKKLNFTLGKVAPETNLNTDAVEAFKGDISIVFEGVSDEYILSFTEDLNNTLPGYLNVESLNIVKANDITKKNVREFFVNKAFHFVKGGVTISWITYKRKGQE